MRRLHRYFFRWQNWVALFLVLVFIGVAVAAPNLSPDDPKNPGPFMQVGRATDLQVHPPSEEAILGTLPRGIDIYHALVWGSRDALQFGLIVTVSTALFGIFYGSLAGIISHRAGGLLMSIADAFIAFPPIAGVVFLQQLFAATITAMGGLYFKREGFGEVIDIVGPVTPIQALLETIDPLMFCLIVLSWMPYARLVHSIVLTLRDTEFVQAARALGGNSLWVIRKHLISNSFEPAMVLAARDVGGVVLFQATLTFIGIGGGSVWGVMLAQGRNWVIAPGGNLFTYWWVFLPPTLAVMIFGIAWNMLGDGLSDILNPTSQHEFYSKSF